MPLTFAHLPIVVLFFAMVAVPSAISYVLLIAPSTRIKGKKLWWGSFIAGVGIAVYQLAYIPVLLLGLALSWIFSRYILIGSISQSFGATSLLLLFYVFWFVVLVCGYISGFKIGLRFGSSTPFKECLRDDYLLRSARWFLEWIAALKRRNETGA